MRARKFCRLILGLLSLAAAGCLPNAPYRLRDAAVESRSSEEKRDYDLAYIEFDEQGDFWDRDQLRRAVDLVKQVPQEKKPLLVLYVHGWQNNASDASSDVPQFHRVLEKLARTRSVHDYQVLGVYLGWRGKQAYDPLLKIISFKNRKDAAMRMGGSNTITEAIFRVVYEARLKSGARTILIGHSFGALVVERAVEQAMTGGLLNGTPILPADLVLLVNSAAESIYAKEMRDMMVSTLHFETGQKCYQRDGDAGCYMKDEPRIISVTSVTDQATGLAFPIGATLFGAGKLYRQYDTPEGGKISQRLFFTHTPGHNERLLDHAILPLEIAGPPPHFTEGFEENLQFPQALPASSADAQATPIFATGGELTDQGTTTPWRWWRINYTGSMLQRSPFWIVKVPKEILDGHGNIFNPNAIDMMAALFRSSIVLNDAGTTKPAIKVKAEPTTSGQPLVETQPLAAPIPSPNEPPVAAAPATGAGKPKARKKRARQSPFAQLVDRRVMK